MWKKLIPLPNICASWSFSIPKHVLRAGAPDAAPIYLQSHHPLKRDQHLNGTDETSKDSGRRTSGISPGQFVTKLEQNLSVGHEVWQRDFVAYSLPERWASTAATALDSPNTIADYPNSERRIRIRVGRRRRIDARARSAFDPVFYRRLA